MDLEKIKKYIDRAEVGLYNAETLEEVRRERNKKYRYILRYKAAKEKRKKERRKRISRKQRPYRLLESQIRAIIRKEMLLADTDRDKYTYQRHLYELECRAKWGKKYSRGIVTGKKFAKILKMIVEKRVEEYMNTETNKEKLKIMCIVGESGSGKTLASLHLKYKLDANVICSFTTRPPRQTEVEGRDHHFVHVYPEEAEVLAMTTYGDHLYYALKYQVFGPCTVYVIDEDGIRDLMDVHGDEYRLFKVYLKRDMRLKIKSGVRSGRTKRDKDRTPFDESFYDYVVENNSTKRHLFEEIERIYNEIKNME